MFTYKIHCDTILQTQVGGWSAYHTSIGEKNNKVFTWKILKIGKNNVVTTDDYVHTYKSYLYMRVLINFLLVLTGL